MFLITRQDESIVEVLELQEPEAFLKRDLLFPSGEFLPRCWLNPSYRQS